MFFRPFRKLSINHVPVSSVLMMGVISCVLAMTGSFDTLTDYVIFGSWIFYALITSTIFIYRRKYRNLRDRTGHGDIRWSGCDFPSSRAGFR